MTFWFHFSVKVRDTPPPSVLWEVIYFVLEMDGLL